MKQQIKEPNLFKPLPFYHPAPENKGLAVSFSYNSSEDKLYLNLLRQTNYDPETQRGLFGGEDKKVVKFSQIEASEIAQVLQSKGDFHAVHKFNVTTNTIALTATLNHDFLLKIKQDIGGNVENFETVLTRGEANLLRLYIEAAIQESFFRLD